MANRIGPEATQSDAIVGQNLIDRAALPLPERNLAQCFKGMTWNALVIGESIGEFGAAGQR